MEQQAWYLRSLVEQLDRQEAEDEEAPNGSAAEFARLKNQSIKYRTDKIYTTKTAEKTENIKKNRYKDILPFDHSRVKLTLTTSKNDTDYINANFIKGVSGSRAYIATQGPLPHTLLDFLRMLWEYNIQVVVMACREFEMGKKKCECYWPKGQDEPFVCEPFTIYTDSEESKGDYVTRTLRVTYRSCSRTLKQLHYVNWPDHGVPDSIPPILDMLDEMRSYQAHDDTPICIHCSAGCGRTGVLCVIDYTWSLLKEQRVSSDFNIYDLVQTMRTQRTSVVQTKEQYVLVYRTIKLLFERYLQSVDAQEYRNEIQTDQLTVRPFSILTEIDNKDYDFSEGFDAQFLPIRENDYPVIPSASENCVSTRSKTQSNNEQWLQQQAYPEGLQVTSFCNVDIESSPELPFKSQTSPETEKRIQDSNIILDRPVSVEVICHMVEDPYFDDKPWSACDTPLVSLNDQPVDAFSFTDSSMLEAHTDDEAPPPLPERTPESFVIAEAESAEPFTRLEVVIPPNAAAAAVRELQGSPPSPIPPLPERTPESFVLATEPAPEEQKVKAMPAVNLNLLGISSEWSGSSGAGAHQSESKSWVRSKSLRAKMTFTEFPQHTSDTSPRFSLHCPPLNPPAPLLLPQGGAKIHPLPERAAGPSTLTQDNIHGKSGPGPQLLQTTQPTHRIGISSEWDGTPQPMKFHDVVKHRSKSVRAKSPEPLTVASQHALPPAVGPEAGGGSGAVSMAAQEELPIVRRRSSLNSDMTENKAVKSTEKSMSRSRSLKFFRCKHKSKVESPAAQPAAPPPSHGASSSFFGLGFVFGKRFGKPKGPRNYPETWF